MPTIGIINVGVSNIGSLSGALYSEGWDTKNVSRPEDFEGLSHLLLPGVGAYAVAMKRLAEAGLIECINKFAEEGHPIMGICLGMQLLADKGHEGGKSRGLGLIPGSVELLDRRKNARLPHVGWNHVKQVQQHVIFKGVRPDVDFYFVHSYQFLEKEKKNTFGTTRYGTQFTSVVGRMNVVGLQFHPEKSQRNGLLLLDNFCLWDGEC